tara:strand:- start:234 stop:614 length:381 start_codon:yes stop_codon:yes gene_type:complete
MKYILKQDNYYSHIGTDLVENSVPLDFDHNFSASNEPTKFHYWNGEEFVLDTELYKSSLEQSAQQIIYKKCDELQAKLQKNESYSYLSDYQSLKDSIVLQLKTNRARITTFSALTIKELEDFVNNN